jgi:hypothetical protein
VTWTRLVPSPESKRADRGLVATRSVSSPSGSQRLRSDVSTNASNSRSPGTATLGRAHADPTGEGSCLTGIPTFV